MLKQSKFEIKNASALENAKAFHEVFKLLEKQGGSYYITAAINGLFAIELFIKAHSSTLSYENDEQEMDLYLSRYPVDSEPYKELKHAKDAGVKFNKFVGHTGGVKSHKLIDLYNNLPDAIRKEIGAHQFDFDLESFLTEYSNGFAELRYYHENPHDFKIPQLRDISKILDALNQHIG